MLVSTAACATTGAATPTGTATSANNNELIIYTTFRSDFYESIIDKWIEYSGIVPDIMQAGTGELLARVRAESANPMADVMWGGLLASVKPSMYLFEDYRVIHEPYLQEHLRNVEGSLTRFSNNGSVLMVNTELIGDIQVRGYADLLNPALRGRIAMTDPSASSSAFEHLVNKLYAMGNGNPNDGWEFVEALIYNVDGVMLGSSGAVTRGVAEGEYLVGLTFEEGPMPFLMAGAPVEVVYMEEGVVFNPSCMFLINGARNADNARRFMDFVMSYEIQSYMQGNLQRRSVRADVTAYDLLQPISQINVIFDDGDYVQLNRDVWLEQFQDIWERLN